MYGLTKGLKLVKVKRFLKTDSFEIYIPNGVDGISRHYKSNELSAHLAYVSTSYEKALAMQKKLRKQKEKQGFKQYGYGHVGVRIETLPPLPTYPLNPFEDEIEDEFEVFNEFVEIKGYKEGFDDGYKKGFDDSRNKSQAEKRLYEKYLKAYKKVCKQLAEKTIAPKEYWEKWGLEDDQG